ACPGEVLEKPREAEPVVRVAVSDVDTRDRLAEGLRPGGDLVRVLEGQQGVDEDPVGRTGDQRAAGRRPGGDLTLPELIGTGVRPHRGDVDVNRERSLAHGWHLLSVVSGMRLGDLSARGCDEVFVGVGVASDAPTTRFTRGSLDGRM